MIKSIWFYASGSDFKDYEYGTLIHSHLNKLAGFLLQKIHDHVFAYLCNALIKHYLWFMFSL